LTTPGGRALRHPLLAVGGALAFAASAPPSDLQPGILVGLVGFALALEHAETPRRGAWLGLLFGLAANVVALRFVPDVIERFTGLHAALGWLALVLLSGAQALPWAAAGAAARLLAARRALVPSWLAFAIGVYLATLLPGVFPWTPAGGLARWPVVLQTAEVVGERGTSFLVAIACGLVAHAVVELRAARPRSGARSIALAGGVLGARVAYGVARSSAVDAARARAPSARVALVQPDFDALLRWDDRHAGSLLERLRTLTRQAEASGAVLTVWPESAYPYPLAHGIASAPRGARAVLGDGVRGPVLTGAYLTKGHGLGTNSAILVEPDGAVGASYDKRHLLWFGETIPLADVFPVLRRVFARGAGIEPGGTSVAFTTGPIRLAVLNCYEDTLPAAGREAMEVRPNLLVNVTNDAWFAGSAEGELHLRLAVLRAIETRRDLVRAVNRGPTSWVDATGRVRFRRDAGPAPFGASFVVADAALLDLPPTLYARAGDLPLLLLVASALVFAEVRRSRGRRTRPLAGGAMCAKPSRDAYRDPASARRLRRRDRGRGGLR
jgi:apolipoprotein N-acyltransferase